MLCLSDLAALEVSRRSAVRINEPPQEFEECVLGANALTDFPPNGSASCNEDADKKADNPVVCEVRGEISYDASGLPRHGEGTEDAADESARGPKMVSFFHT
ncbi:hypothetical protein OESDEN_17513 [Oesophagostomum dentatum]|uniref:Uncharacterized protein n=1 Tax=Oesophagostomum dentatum TaxID=61180 RepID=A0A0B1SGW9_OESDE|nr:hypothetical protein OESDEN_17513 [Oesophagostomum dentatum]